MGDEFEFQNEVGLLRAIVRNLKREVAPLHPDYIAHMRANNVPLPSEEGQSKTSILPDGRKAFGDLADCLVARSPPMARGTVHDNVLGELFKQLETFLGRDPSSIVAADAQALSDHMLRWFEASAGPRRVFVPCVLTPHAAPSFRIGPVAFVFIDDISVSGWAPDLKADELDRHAFGQLVKWMKEAHGNWLASLRHARYVPPRSTAWLRLQAQPCRTGRPLQRRLDTYGGRDSHREGHAR